MPYHTPVPVPHCPVVGGGGHHRPPDLHPSVLQLIKYQSVQSKVRLVCARENQKSLSRDFIFPSARVSGTSCALGCQAYPGEIWGLWEYRNKQISGLRTETTPASWLLHLGVLST